MGRIRRAEGRRVSKSTKRAFRPILSSAPAVLSLFQRVPGRREKEEDRQTDRQTEGTENRSACIARSKSIGTTFGTPSRRIIVFLSRRVLEVILRGKERPRARVHAKNLFQRASLDPCQRYSTCDCVAQTNIRRSVRSHTKVSLSLSLSKL